MIVSVEEEIRQVAYNKPHVVILGAGASRAACPGGDATGRALPVMADFTRLVPVAAVAPELAAAPDFEAAYSRLAQTPSEQQRCAALERLIYDYFAALELPNTPTIYDHLVLSLRPKDVIATFNWDPFLVQAVNRFPLKGRAPRLLFLHGNVKAGYCLKDGVHGVNGANCSKCRQPFQPSKLLYPVNKKDYSSDSLIAKSWTELRNALKNAFMVTVFGYGAPASDHDAMKLLRRAWGTAAKRNFEQFEMIDIRDEDELRHSWKAFIHTHHYDVHRNFYASFIANHPRRTGEAYWNQNFEAKFIEDHPVPQSASPEELWDWYQPLLRAEDAASS